MKGPILAATIAALSLPCAFAQQQPQQQQQYAVIKRDAFVGAALRACNGHGALSAISTKRLAFCNCAANELANQMSSADRAEYLANPGFFYSHDFVTKVISATVACVSKVGRAVKSGNHGVGDHQS